MLRFMLLATTITTCAVRFVALWIDSEDPLPIWKRHGSTCRLATNGHGQMERKTSRCSS